MGLFDNIPESYNENKKPGKSYANAFSPVSFTDLEFTQRKNVIRSVRKKNLAGKYGLDSNLLFDDLKLTPARIRGIERMIKTADEKKVITQEFKQQIRSTFREYENWNHRSRKKTKSELRYKIRNKIFSIEIALNLALSNPNSPLFKSYLNTIYFCQSMYQQDGYKITSKYCNNRHCYSCNRIRTGKLMNNYMPFVEWMQDDMCLVTLTIPSISAEDLRSSIEQMKQTFTFIKDVMRKRETKLTGLRKLECTYNTEKDTYHPHFHVLVKGYKEAIELYRLWFDYIPKVSYKGQDIVEADVNSAKELFKYFTKFWSKKQNGINTNKIIDYQAQDKIYNAIKGMRIFQSFGMNEFKEQTQIEIDESEEIEVNTAGLFNIAPDEENFYFNPDTYNYMANDGTELIDFKMNKKDKKLLSQLDESVIESAKEKRKELTDPLKEIIIKNWWSDSS